MTSVARLLAEATTKQFATAGRFTAYVDLARGQHLPRHHNKVLKLTMFSSAFAAFRVPTRAPITSTRSAMERAKSTPSSRWPETALT